MYLVERFSSLDHSEYNQNEAYKKQKLKSEHIK